MQFYRTGIMLPCFIKNFLFVYWLRWGFIEASGGCSPVVVLELLISVASPVVEHGLQGARVHQLWLTGTRAPSQ